MAVTVTAVSAGAVEYLLRASGCAEHAHQPSPAEQGLAKDQGLGANYLVASAERETAGVWYGGGLHMLGIAAGTQATEADVRAVFGKLMRPGSNPKKPEFLGSPPRQFRTTEARLAEAFAAEPDASEERQREIRNEVFAATRKPVAYYDLTFSPVKSVSVMHAALVSEGRHAEAALIIASHQEAIAEAMAYVQDQTAYTRSGYHGRTVDGQSVGVYERGTGLLWIRWDHSTNRAQEPQMHAHVTVLNRLVTASDGVIRALDGKGFKPIKAGANAIYTRALERLICERVEASFALRPDGKAREIMGIDPRLLADASSRGRQVEGIRDAAVAEFEATYGRSPSPAQRKEMWDKAKMQDRPRKAHEPPSRQLATWSEPRRATLRASLARMAEYRRGVDAAGKAHTPDTERTKEQVLAAAVNAAQAKYSTWTVGNLTDAIHEQQNLTPAVTGTLIELTSEVLRHATAYGIVALAAKEPAAVPAELQLGAGKSKYRRVNDDRYATLAHLGTETGIVVAARQGGAPALAGPELELARVELLALGLGPDQQAAVLGIVSSGRAADVLIGPAGAGKSRTVGALAGVWTDRIGGRMLGLAMSERATSILRDDGLDAINTTVFLHRFTPDQHGRVRDRITPTDLVVVDEASMSSTDDIAAISAIVAAGGGKLLYTGDHEQLGAIGAGGMLELLAADNGAYELTGIHRFTHEWERDASARLRVGDETVLDVYEDHARIHGGSAEDMFTAAGRAYLADTLAGKNSLLIVGSNTDATDLSKDIRTELVRLGRVQPEVLGTLRDGNFVGAGDLIQARANARTIRVDGPGMVTNLATYRVLGRDRLTGTLRVQDTTDGLVAHLPRNYVAQHVTLGYAVTTYAAEGLTVDTSHGVLTRHTTRAGAYVPATRGREANTLYVICEREPDEHEPERLASTPRAVLRDVLANTSTDARSAELTRRAGLQGSRSIAFLGTELDLLAAESGQQRYTHILTQVLPGGMAAQVAAEHGAGRLTRAIREAELAGHDPTAVLTDAVHARTLADADSVSDVLRWRVQRMLPDRVAEHPGGPLAEQNAPSSWLGLAALVPDGEVGDYARELAVAATARQAELGEHAAGQPPQWALTHLGQPPSDHERHGEWVHRVGVAAAYRELRNVPDTSMSLGAAPDRDQVFHHALWQQAYTALGAPSDVRDYAAATDTELRTLREAWRREETWAPYSVAGEIQDARHLAQEYRDDGVLWRAEADLLPAGSSRRAQAQAEILGVHTMAAHYTARAEHLQVIHTAREQWSRDTAPARAQFEQAGDELARRGLPRDPQPTAGEQTELFDVVEPVAEPQDTPTDEHTRVVDTEPARQELRLDLEVNPEAVEADLQAVHVARVAPQRTHAPELAAGQTSGPARAHHPGPAADAQPDPAAAQQPREQTATEGPQDARAPQHTAGSHNVDDNQGVLFAAEPAAVDIAAAAPLRSPADPATDTEQDPVTVGQARRQAEISAALRAGRAAAATVADWELDLDDTAHGVSAAHLRRDHTDLDQTLPSGVGQDSGAGQGMGMGR